jgi:ubiquinone/menaquinone biosynthesis C-methylase UbiE
VSKSTSWGKVANWYNNLIEKGQDSYQKKLILPNLIRLLEVRRGEVILDLACGQGFFSREFQKEGAKVIGVDVSKELIDLAKKHNNNSTIKQFYLVKPGRWRMSTPMICRMAIEKMIKRSPTIAEVRVSRAPCSVSGFP